MGKNKQYEDLILPPGTQKTLKVAKRVEVKNKYCKERIKGYIV